MYAPPAADAVGPRGDFSWLPAAAKSQISQNDVYATRRVQPMGVSPTFQARLIRGLRSLARAPYQLNGLAREGVEERPAP